MFEIFTTNFLFEIAESLSNLAAVVRDDFELSLESARDHSIVMNADVDTFHECIIREPAVPDISDQSIITEHQESQEEVKSNVTNEPTVVDGDISKPLSLNLEEILYKTTLALATVDFQSAGVCIEELNNGELSETSRKQIQSEAKEIQDMLARSREGQFQDTQKALSTAKDVTKASESLVESVLRTETHIPSTSEYFSIGTTGYRLDTNKLLDKKKRQYLLHLFRALVYHLQCCNEKHFVRLRLTGFLRPMDKDSQHCFQFYLSNGYDCTRSSWVESKFSLGKLGLTDEDQRECRCIHEAIRQNKGLGLCFADGIIQGSRSCEGTGTDRGPVCASPIQFDISRDSNSLSTPVTPMSSLLKHNKLYCQTRHVFPKMFSVTEKDQLCFTLALSLLQMCGRDWERITWYSDDPNAEDGIFFLKNPSTQSIPCTTESYLSLRLQDKPSSHQSDENLQCDPQLLDFARLLIQIQTWERVPNPSVRPNQFIGHTASKEEIRAQVLEDIKTLFRTRSGHDRYFTSALYACLGEEGRRKAAAKDKPDELQFHIFKNIVTPLHEYLGKPDLANYGLEEILSTNNFAATDLQQQNAMTRIYDLSIADGIGNEDEGKGPNESMFWDKLEEFKGRFIDPPHISKDLAFNGPWKGQKVRIAVLDSGVNEEDPTIAAAINNDQIRECRNFTSLDPGDYEDTIGHGTRVTRLLLRVASPEVEVYIAKVTDTDKMANNKLYCIANAIKWAVMEWDVHIISMSLTFAEVHHEVNEELTQALSPTFTGGKGRLVFAASGNLGAYKSLAWPATKKEVISVFATDWSGEGTKSAPNPQGELNVATLGQDIKMRCLDDRGTYFTDSISGSSYATPIAAGIAANILECTRHDPKMNEWTKGKLCSHDGMKKILNAMASHRKGYDFLHPLEFWNKAYVGGKWNELHLPDYDHTNIYEVLRYLVA